MRNVSRKMDIRKNKKEILEIKYTETEIKNSLMGSSIDMIYPRKESMRLKICQ